MARRRQVSRGTRRAGAAGRGWQGAPHRVGDLVVAAAVAAEVSRAPKLAEPATQAGRWEARRGPGGRLLGIAGCLAIRAGWDPGDWWVGDSRLSGLCRKPPTAWNAVSIGNTRCRGASRVSWGKGSPRCGGSLHQTPGRSGRRASVSPKLGAGVLFRLQRPRVRVPVWCRESAAS